MPGDFFSKNGQQDIIRKQSPKDNTAAIVSLEVAAKVASSTVKTIINGKI